MDEGKGFFKNFEKENLKKEDENMKKGKTNFNEK